MEDRFSFSILLFTIAFLSTATAKDGDVFSCAPYEIVSAPTSDRDQKFIAANMRKEFQIFDQGQTIIVVTKSQDFRDSAQTYQTLSRGLLVSVAVSKEMGIGLDSIAFDEDGEGGQHKATLSLQGAIFTTSWMLNCVRTN